MAALQERRPPGMRLVNIINTAFHVAGAVVGVAFGLADVYILLVKAAICNVCAYASGCPSTGKSPSTANAIKLESNGEPQPLPGKSAVEPHQQEPHAPQRSYEPTCGATVQPVDLAAPPSAHPQAAFALAADTVSSSTFAGQAPAAAPAPVVPEPAPAAEASWASEAAVADAALEGATNGGSTADSSEGLPPAGHDLSSPGPPETLGEVAVSSGSDRVAEIGVPEQAPVTPASTAALVPAPTTPASNGTPAAQARHKPAGAGVTSPAAEDARSEGGDSSTTALSYSTANSVDPVSGAPTSRRLKAAAASSAGGGGGQSYAQRLEEKRQHGRRKGAHKATTR